MVLNELIASFTVFDNFMFYKMLCFIKCYVNNYVLKYNLKNIEKILWCFRELVSNS